MSSYSSFILILAKKSFLACSLMHEFGGFGGHSITLKKHPLNQFVFCTLRSKDKLLFYIVPDVKVLCSRKSHRPNSPHHTSVFEALETEWNNNDIINKNPSEGLNKMLIYMELIVSTCSRTYKICLIIILETIFYPLSYLNSIQLFITG